MYLYINIYYLKMKKFKYDPGDTVKTGKKKHCGCQEKQKPNLCSYKADSTVLSASRLILLKRKWQLSFQDGLVSLFSLGLLLWIGNLPLLLSTPCFFAHTAEDPLQSDLWPGCLSAYPLAFSLFLPPYPLPFLSS